MADFAPACKPACGLADLQR